jgi:hypothetical protein
MIAMYPRSMQSEYGSIRTGSPGTAKITATSPP